MQVSPVILIAAACAVVVLLVAVVLPPGEGGSLDVPSAVNAYVSFRNSKPGTSSLPTPEQVRRLLMDVNLMESGGHKAEARLLWQTILIQTGLDPVNPLRETALEHLNELK